ncbi:MAG: GYF domain-containing protein [Myxococcota bacterium]
MKFLCNHCKAKYQIPDEKIAGRNLRMKCRKCGNEIIIRGPKSAEAPRAAARTARRGGSGAMNRPSRPAGRSALGAEFRRGAALAPAPPPKAAPVEWYVAINDVPVGPIKREEVARKIGMGAVSATSLCWREGLGDWQKVADVPELASLLQQRRVPAPPPPRPKRPPPPARKKDPPPSNVIPIGGRQGAAPSPLDFDDDEKTVMSSSPFAEPAPEPKQPAAPPPSDDDLAFGAPIEAAAPAAATTPAAAPAAAPAPAPPATFATEPSYMPPKRRQLSVPAIGLIFGCVAFGVALAVVVGQRMLADDPQPVAAADTSETAEPAQPAEAVPDIPPEVEEPEQPVAETEGEPEEAGEETPEDTSEGTSARRTTPRNGTRMTSAMAGSMTDLTDEQRALLERFGDSSGGPTIMRQGLSGSGSAMTGMALDSAALTRVVRAPANQRALQRCYETAIRGNPNPPEARVDVNLRILGSGRVQSATVRGDNVGSLRQCLTGVVRRWRFPATGAETQTSFPLVFGGR